MASGGPPFETSRPGTVEFEREFAFADSDERLPWLESDDDDLEQASVDTGRIASFLALALLVVVLIAGTLWFFLREKPEALVADGSVIEAPDEPYRTRPENPGGRQVAGTGDTSFEVAEGKRVEGKIVEPAAPSPSIDREQAQGDAAPAAPSGAIGVQVGAYLSREAAEAGWSTLSARLEPLQGRNHRVVEGMADAGKVFRLQALAGSLAEAQALCATIKSSGGDCQVKR